MPAGGCRNFREGGAGWQGGRGGGGALCMDTDSSQVGVLRQACSGVSSPSESTFTGKSGMPPGKLEGDKSCCLCAENGFFLLFVLFVSFYLI